MSHASTRIPLSRSLFFALEAARDFTSTGAVAPSSRSLAHALTAHARRLPPEGLRILEVGAGTGPATALLLPLVRRGADLDVIEPNPRFVTHLRAMAASAGDEEADARGGQVTIHQTTLEGFDATGAYDVIVSGLPLKNFSPEGVRSLMDKALALLAPGGTFTAFSYVGALRLRALTASRTSLRAHVRVEDVIDELRERHGGASTRVWGNLPPAEVWSLGGARRSTGGGS